MDVSFQIIKINEKITIKLKSISKKFNKFLEKTNKDKSSQISQFFESGPYTSINLIQKSSKPSQKKQVICYKIFQIELT